MNVDRYIAKVVSNQDPALRGRLKIVCADLTGDPDAELPDWIEPVLDWGFFLIPDVDELVEIEVVIGTAEDEIQFQSGILDPQIRWRGKRFYHDSDEVPTVVHDDLKINYGKRRGFATPAGHILYFDDTEGQEKIRLSLALSEGGGGEYAYIDFDNSGNILLANGPTNGAVLLGAGADAAGAAAWLVRGDEWKQWAETHTHPTGTGPSGPPSQPIPATVLSETTKVK